MNLVNKRSLLKTAALSALALAALAGCGKKEEAPVAAPAPAATPAADKLKVGFVYVSPIGDGERSSAQHEPTALDHREISWNGRKSRAGAPCRRRGKPAAVPPGEFEAAGFRPWRARIRERAPGHGR